MAQTPRTNPDGDRPQTVDELVAALLVLGIDVHSARDGNAARARAPPNAPAGGVAANRANNAANVVVASESATETATTTVAPSTANADAASEAEGGSTAASVVTDWADDWDEDEQPRRFGAAPTSAAAPTHAAVTTGTGASTTLSGNGYTCSFCQNFNTVRPSESFYVVTIGLQVGIFHQCLLVSCMNPMAITRIKILHPERVVPKRKQSKKFQKKNNKFI
ncbi:hypothetical protein BJ912DRAFT_934374 [Pholiota molesta]|nr:hypothetical protein BJ912DRAFT_934374 [Pholiota molesta]